MKPIEHYPTPTLNNLNITQTLYSYYSTLLLSVPTGIPLHGSVTTVSSVTFRPNTTNSNSDFFTPVKCRDHAYNFHIAWIIIIIHLTHMNIWESIGKPCSCMHFINSHIFYYKSCENLCQLLQVTCAVSEHALK